MKYLYLIAVYWYVPLMIAVGSCVTASLGVMGSWWWVSIPLSVFALFVCLLAFIFNSANFG